MTERGRNSDSRGKTALPAPKRILIVNCYMDDLRVPIRRQTKIPQSMTTAFLAGLFSSRLCNITLYSELYSGPLEDERLLSGVDMLVLTGVNTSFDRMLHLTAYVKSKNSKAVVVAGGSAIRALPEHAKNFFDYCCLGDVEQLSDIIRDAFGQAYVSESFMETGWVIPRYDLVPWMTIMSYIESSRNCYFRCSYCSLTAENGKYQSYEIEYLRQQFMALGKRRMVHFLDNNFASPDRQFILDRFEMLQDLHDAGYFHRWGAEVTSDFFLNDENLKWSYESGCLALFCGVESFDRNSLLHFRKFQNTTLPQVEMIRKCLNAGITFLYGIVLDTTTRRISDLKEELDYIVGNSDITLPAFVTLAIPILKTPYFYDCLEQKRFLPNVKLRDLDGTTITVNPLDSLTETVQFVQDFQTLRGYKIRIMRHMKNFFKKYRKVLSWERMGFAQYCAMHLCTPKLATLGTDVGRILGNGYGKLNRTYLGTSEPLDAVYTPAFRLDSKYEAYFKPTMLTDHHGHLSEALQPDLLMN